MVDFDQHSILFPNGFDPDKYRSLIGSSHKLSDVEVQQKILPEIDIDTVDSIFVDLSNSYYKAREENKWIKSMDMNKLDVGTKLSVLYLFYVLDLADSKTHHGLFLALQQPVPFFQKLDMVRKVEIIHDEVLSKHKDEKSWLAFGLSLLFTGYVSIVVWVEHSENMELNEIDSKIDRQLWNTPVSTNSTITPMIALHSLLDNLSIYPRTDRRLGDSSWVNKWILYLSTSGEIHNVQLPIMSTHEGTFSKNKDYHQIKLQEDIIHYLHKYSTKLEVKKELISYYLGKFSLILKKDDTIINRQEPVLELALKTSLESGERFVFFSVGLISEVKGGHQASLLIDRHKKTYELYDPHGKSSYSVTEYFAHEFRKFLPKDYSFIHFQASIYGIQGYANDDIGFCVVFTMMFQHLRLKFPDLSVETLTRLWRTLSSEQVMDAVLRYTSFVESKMDEIDNKADELGDLELVSDSILDKWVDVSLKYMHGDLKHHVEMQRWMLPPY